jgi:hypothetical protein
MIRLFTTLLFLIFVLAQSASGYTVDFEGAGETKVSYASGTVTLSGLDWELNQSLIGTQANDFRNGARSLRLRGFSNSSATMTQDKTNGLGNISFVYRRFGTGSTP